MACCARRLAATRFRLVRHSPSATLAPFVEYYWIPRWDLRGEPSFAQTILPHPNVHLVFEESGAGIFGVDRRLFTRSLSGRAWRSGYGSWPAASGRSGRRRSRS